MRPKHEDFTFHDHQQTARRFRLGDERGARHEDHAAGEVAAREDRARRPLLAWIHEGIRALLPGSRLL
jgi:hypothetical protein